MPAADDAADEFVCDAADQLRHDLKTPLTTIYTRAYLFERAIRRVPSLIDEERVTMLAGVTTIETELARLTTIVQRINRGDGR
jgi:signal transduction histidine kinase